MLVDVKPVLIFDCISIDEIQIGKSRLSSMNRWFHLQHMAQRGQSSPSAELRRSLWALGWRIRQARCLILISIVLDFWQNGNVSCVVFNDLSPSDPAARVRETECKIKRKCSQYPCFSGYREHFSYKTALGLQLLHIVPLPTKSLSYSNRATL